MPEPKNPSEIGNMVRDMVAESGTRGTFGLGIGDISQLIYEAAKLGAELALGSAAAAAGASPHD